MSAAVELGPDRIRVNAICPGGISTPLISVGRTKETVDEGLKVFQPLPIAGQPEHIAAAALFLASDDSEFVSGHALVVDGGLEAAGPKLFGQGNIFQAMSGVSRGTTGQETTIRS
jgi:NAD(P)-dependent dehydrogenase (short-subunit alcohol dehydrogenase family)